MTNVKKIKNLRVNHFEGKSLAVVCFELTQLGIEPEPFTYKSNTVIKLTDYDDDGYYYEYHIDITDWTCQWSDLVIGDFSD